MQRGAMVIFSLHFLEPPRPIIWCVFPLAPLIALPTTMGKIP